MSNSQNLITEAGLKLLNDELENLRNVERPAVIADIAEARSHGDLRENSEYASAKEKQVFIEGRIAELESLMSRVEKFDPKTVANKKEVRFGAKIELTSTETKDKKHIQIVSPYEADLSQGLVAIDAPVAKVLLGKEVGDKVEMFSKGIKQEFKIKSVEY